MTTTVFQAVAGVVIMLVGFTGKPVIRLGKFRKRPMSRLGQSIVFGAFGAALAAPAALLIVGQEVGLSRLRQWGLALNTDASLLDMAVGGILLYLSYAARRMSGGNPLTLAMFRTCSLAAGIALLATNAYLISLRLRA